MSVGVTPAILHHPRTLDEALELLSDGSVAPLGGATWLMRAPIRGENRSAEYVSTAGIPGMRSVELEGATVRVGGAVTHSQLARAVDGLPELQGLHTAASKSANPAVRSMATVAGNLCSTGFAAADLLPALLALDAEVSVVSQERENRRLTIREFLAVREDLLTGSLLTEVFIPRCPRISAHARLPLREAGDYPVAIVSIVLGVEEKGIVEHARVAVGAVTEVAQRWPELEEALLGNVLDAKTAAAAAEQHRQVFDARSDGVASWYRLEVLPELVRRAIATARSDGSRTDEK